MAEIARTQGQGGQATPEPTTIDLDQPDTSLIQVEPAGDTPLPPTTLETPDPREQEITQLRQQNERLRHQVNGSAAEARRLSAETQANNERIARLEGAIQARGGTSGEPAEPPPAPTFTRGRLKSALQKWLNGDESDLDLVEDELGRIGSHRPTPTSEPPNPSALRDLIRNELQSIGASEVVRSSVATVHPEMADTSSPVYGAVYNAYDAYAADGTNQVMYPRDPRFDLTIFSPDGQESKIVDVRIVRQLAGDVKLALGTRGQSQAAVGQTQGGRGTTTSAPRGSAVEASELLTPQERAEIANFQQLKAWPSTWPRDPKAAARYIFDGLDSVEKARRIAEYRRNSRGLA